MVMNNILVCETCRIELERNEAFLNNSLKFSCEDCWEEWDFEEGLITDNYL